jgi:trigger factor
VSKDVGVRVPSSARKRFQVSGFKFQGRSNLAHLELATRNQKPKKVDISLDQQSVTDGLIRVKLTQTDYLPKVEEKVKEYSRKANIKGFRQGKVPSGIIKKMFGKSILVEEVNHLVSHGISDYIRDKKLRVLGEPLPNQEKARLIDWDTQKDFEFEFQVGMVDDFSYDMSSKVKVTSHPIKVDEKVIDETVQDMQRRFGQVTYPETSEATDNLFGEIPQPDGTMKNAYIPIEKVETKEQKAFIGVKKDDTVTFDIDKVSKDEQVRAQILNVAAEEAKDIKGSYTFKVNSINRVQAAEINQELFDKVFGKDAVHNEEEFRAKIRETIAENYQRETEHLLDHEIQHYFVDHTKINMPENFLKLWLKNASEGQVSDEVIQKEFKSYQESLRWNLIQNKIADDHKITVTAEDVKARAKELIAEQFGGAAIAEQLGERFDQIADSYLAGQDGKGENYMRLYNQLRTAKIFKAIRESITVTEKPVSLEEFRKLAAAHNH